MGCSRFGPRQSWNHPPVVRLLPPTSSAPLVRPPPLSPVLTCPWWGGRGTCSGWLTTALLCACCWPSSCWAVEGVAGPVCPGAQSTQVVGWVISSRLPAAESPSLIAEGLDRGPRWGTPGLRCGPRSARAPALGAVSRLSWMGQCLYPDRSRQRLLEDDVWGQAHAWAGQPRSARGLHRHQATGAATWELALAVLGVAAAGSWPGLKGCSSPAPSNHPSVHSLDSGTPGTLELLFLSS